MTNGKKCPHCANGIVDLSAKLEELKQPFKEIPFQQLVDTDKRLGSDVVALAERFLSKSYKFNNEFSFASATTNKEQVPRRFNVAKYNEVISYNASGINPPQAMPESFAQLHTLRPEDVHLGERSMRNPNCAETRPNITSSDEAIEQQIVDHQVANRIQHMNVPADDVLDTEIIRRLQTYFNANNWLSGVYFHGKEIYDMKVQECARTGEQEPAFRLLLLNQQKVRAHGVNVAAEIHPHRLQQPMERENEFNEQFGLMAQVQFVLLIVYLYILLVIAYILIYILLIITYILIFFRFTFVILLLNLHPRNSESLLRVEMLLPLLWIIAILWLMPCVSLFCFLPAKLVSNVERHSSKKTKISMIGVFYLVTLKEQFLHMEVMLVINLAQMMRTVVEHDLMKMMKVSLSLNFVSP